MIYSYSVDVYNKCRLSKLAYEFITRSALLCLRCPFDFHKYALNENFLLYRLRNITDNTNIYRVTMVNAVLGENDRVSTDRFITPVIRLAIVKKRSPL